MPLHLSTLVDKSYIEPCIRFVYAVMHPVSVHIDLFFDFSEGAFKDGFATLSMLKVVPVAQFCFAWLAAT